MITFTADTPVTSDDANSNFNDLADGTGIDSGVLINRHFEEEAWHEVGETDEPAYENGWVKYDDDGTYDGAFFKIDAMGVVHLRGLIKSGTIDTVMFTLPAGYRPGYTTIFAGDSNNAPCRIDINTAGGILNKDGVTAWVSLSGISFKAEG
jgi:hypothetical protein